MFERCHAARNASSRPARRGLPTRVLRAALLALALSGSLANAQSAPDPLFNPRPLPDDLELPLPCNGKLVLRYIYVLSKGLFDDREVGLGYSFSENEPGYRQSFLAGYRRDFVNGQFLLEDLPQDWQVTLKKTLANLTDKAKGGTLQPIFYFIGKYEISELQYKLVMDQEARLKSSGSSVEPPACQPLDPAAVAQRLPKVNLSWFDANHFTEVYTQWLARYARDRLPAVAGGPDKGGSLAFIRLPSETEWEFAARGGHAVDRQGLEARVFPRPVEGGGDGPLSDWAVYRAVAGGSGFTARLLPIGSKRPNPAGLHDVLGNAAEIVLEPFHLVRGGGRFHGATGGFIVKGGNYQESDLYTGMRREYPFFNVAGDPQRNETTGFRIVIAAISAPTARFQNLFEQWQQDGRMANLSDEIDRIKDPTQRLAAILAATQDEKLKKALGEINEELKRNVSLLAEQRKTALSNLIKAGAMVAETIKNYNARLCNIQDRLQRAQAAHNDREVLGYKSAIPDGQKAVKSTLSIYLDDVASCTAYPEAVVQEQAGRVREELGHQDVLGESLLNNSKLFLTHVGQHRKSQRSDSEQVLADILADVRKCYK